MSTAVEYANKALSHLGESGPRNTCLSNGIQRWAKECNLPQLGDNTPSVSAYRRAATADGLYHNGMSGVTIGDILDWENFAHVSVVTSIDSHGNIKSIGSGTPSEKVAYQPASGGYNSPDNFRGYIRLPFAGADSQPRSDVYTVKKGDTLSAIGDKYNVKWSALAAYNKIAEPDIILPGQKILIPNHPVKESYTYTVKKGDTLSAIAYRFKTTVAKLAKTNKIKNVNLIHPGDRIVIK